LAGRARWVDRFGLLIGSVAIVNALLVIAVFGIWATDIILGGIAR